MLNLMVLDGRVVKDPLVGEAKNGNKMASFTIAWSQAIKDKENVVLYLDCVAFSKNAELAEKYFIKGKPVTVTGELLSRSYVDRDGSLRYKISMRVRDIHFHIKDRSSIKKMDKKEENSIDKIEGIEESKNDVFYLENGKSQFNELETDELLPF